MADTIPDLWPDAALKLDALSPKVILRNQATRLGQRTSGILVGELAISDNESGQAVLGLEIVAPALNNYRYRLLSVSNAQDASYPAVVAARGIENTAYCESDFVQILTDALQSPETVALLQSLIIRSNEDVSRQSFHSESMVTNPPSVN